MSKDRDADSPGIMSGFFLKLTLAVDTDYEGHEGPSLICMRSHNVLSYRRMESLKNTHTHTNICVD